MKNNEKRKKSPVQKVVASPLTLDTLGHGRLQCTTHTYSSCQAGPAMSPAQPCHRPNSVGVTIAVAKGVQFSIQTLVLGIDLIYYSSKTRVFIVYNHAFMHYNQNRIFGMNCIYIKLENGYISSIFKFMILFSFSSLFLRAYI